MKKKQTNVNGKQITFYESRDNGPAVVFVHGFSSSSSIFIRQLIDSVLSYKYRIIAVDLIGHGNADFANSPDKDYSISGLAQFLTDLCSSLGIKDAVYAGHNIGGNIILEAYESLNNPLGVALLSSFPFSKPFSDEIFISRKQKKLLSKAEIDEREVDQIASLLVEKETSYPEFIPEVIRKTDIKTRQVFFESIDKEDYSDQIEKINNIKVPIAIFVGESEQLLNTEYLKSVGLKNLWKNDIQIISNAGHIFFYENPADFNVSLDTFLADVFKL